MNDRIAAWVVAALGLALATGAMPARAQQTSTPQTNTATATFAAGCFWCVEEVFDKVDGVLETISGYTGGSVENPSYEQVSSGGTGHTEAVRIVYDPAKVRYERLLQVFWHNVDPFDARGQFCDRGEQYRSGIFAHTPEQQRLAAASKASVEAQFGKPVATRVYESAPFYDAEDYHQNYYARNALRYRFYKWSCGREQRLDDIWGESRKAKAPSPGGV